MRRIIRVFATGLAVALAGCGPDYSPDTYSTAAVQQANKVEAGVVIGVRRVEVSSAGVVGAVSGAAAGGAVGAQTPGGGLANTFGVIGGGLVGGLVGTAVEHTTADTSAYEYIVRKPNGDLVSVTQRDAVPLALGQTVLVIAGNQARIVPDYTVNPDAAALPLPPPRATARVSKPQPAAGTVPSEPTRLTPATVVEPPPVPVTAEPLPSVVSPSASLPAPSPPPPAIDPAAPVPASGSTPLPKVITPGSPP